MSEKAMSFSYSVKVLVYLLLLQLPGLAVEFPEVWHVPPENLNFIGREDILEEIGKNMKDNPLKTVVIKGPQGFGKSQIAKKYIYRKFSDYDVVWWFRANQYLKPQFEAFALAMAAHLGLAFEKSIQSMGAPHLIQLIKEGIRRKNLKCLIIFDDAQNYSDIEPYVLFSHTNTIHTLVTTKNGNFSADAISIKAFKRKDSIAYLTLFLLHEPEASKDKLSESLNDCPAALSLAIDYIKGYPGMTIERYLEKHQSNKRSLPALMEVSKKLGSSIDDYETDLSAATQMNMEKLREKSTEAFQLLGFLAILQRDEIPWALIEKWAQTKGIKTDILNLVSLIKQDSLIDLQTKSTTGACVTMQELIQKIVSSLIPVHEKKERIAEAAKLLSQVFTARSDKNVEAILQDNKPLLNTLQVSREADAIGFHCAELTQIRIRSLDVLVGMIQDFGAARELIAHLKKDLEGEGLQAPVTISKTDEVIFLANMALYSSLDSPQYDKSLPYSLKALRLVEKLDDMPEEHVRILSNLVQYHVLCGLLDEASRYVEMGEKVRPQSQSNAYNLLFVLAKNVFMLDKRDVDGVVTAVKANQDLMDRLDGYPSMRYFILCQLAEALIRKGNRDEATQILSAAEKFGCEFHGSNKKNFLFGKLYFLKAMNILDDPQAFETAKGYLNKSIEILEAIFRGPDKHRNQAFAHLLLGKLYHQHKDYRQAKLHYLQSEAIYDKILKKKRIEDVSDLYKQLAILGMDAPDEALTHMYLKKHIKVFGLDHPGTLAITVYADERGLRV